LSAAPTGHIPVQRVYRRAIDGNDVSLRNRHRIELIVTRALTNMTHDGSITHAGDRHSLQQTQQPPGGSRPRQMQKAVDSFSAYCALPLSLPPVPLAVAVVAVMSVCLLFQLAGLDSDHFDYRW
jgi:hypothetical protein